MRCPCCNSATSVNTLYENNEMSCSDCGAEFAIKFEELNVYVPGTYKKLCESVLDHISNKTGDPMVVSSLKNTFRGFANDGEDRIDQFVERLTEEAEILYSHFLAGHKSKEYFGSILEGIETLQNWQKYNESGFFGISAMPSIISPQGAGDELEQSQLQGVNGLEQQETNAINAAKNAATDLDGALGDMEAAHTKEIGGVPTPCGFQGSNCDPLTSPIMSRLPVNTLQTGAISAFPSVSNTAPTDVIGDPSMSTSVEDQLLPFPPIADETDPSNPEIKQESLVTENYCYSVGDTTIVNNNIREKWKIYAIREGKLYLQLGEQRQIVDPETDDIQLAEDTYIYAERVAKSEEIMKKLWKEMENKLDNSETLVGTKGWKWDEEVTESKKVETAEGSDKPIHDAEGGKQSEGKSKPAKSPGDRHGEYVKKHETAIGSDKPVHDSEGGKQLEDAKKIGESVIGDHFRTPTGEKRPFPYTQDPLNTHNDHFDKNETGDLEIMNRVTIAKVKGTVPVDDVAAIAKTVVGGDSSGGNAMGESISHVREKDLIYINENFSNQWSVSKIYSPNKVTLKSGNKTRTFDPLTESFCHVDGVSNAWERESDRITSTRKLWESIEKQYENTETLNNSEYTTEEKEDEVVCAAGMSAVCPDGKKAVCEVNEIYAHIKSSGLYLERQTSALQKLVSKYGNDLEQLSSILEDAVASQSAGNEKIEDLYGYVKGGDLDTKFALEAAWRGIQEEEGKKKVINTSWSLVTPESAENGDFADSGMLPGGDEFVDDEDGSALEKSIKWLKQKGAVYPSNSHFSRRTWYSSDPIQDYKSGNEMTHSYHLEGFSEPEEKSIFAAITNKVQEGLTDSSDGKHAEKQLAIGKHGLNTREPRGGGFNINL